MSGEGDIGDEDRVLSGEYVLGLLDAAERSAFEARLAQEPDLRAHVAAWEDDFAAMAATLPEVAPPASIWTRIERELFASGQGGSFWSRVGVLQIVLGAAAAALIAFAAVQFDILGPPFDPEFRADIVAEDAGLSFVAEYDTETGNLLLTRAAGGPAPGRSLEIWLVAGSDAPVSIMVWPNGSEREEIILPAPVAAALPRGILAISDEPEGGSPTGAPTGAVLATGEVQPI
ncbi:anti-sigma factor domain-containing protein [Pseudooceanicola sp. LIPI14-2-Ac024]|uniref:anti-sigma factor n=1 Tax=Pseudooceanicola sp. LIPI14-2-Ac024 TaxID=3344875 RepID=UPI0035D0542D